MTTTLTTYSKYKNSGVEWIDTIPSDWNHDKIVSLFDFLNDKVSDVDYEPLSVTYGGVKKQVDDAAKTDNGSNRKLLKIDDIAFNGRSDRRGACGVSEFEGSISVVYHVLRKKSLNIDVRYFHHLFRNTLFSQEFYRWGRGIHDDMWTTRVLEMKRIQVPVPPLETQMKIADFLDEKTKAVDTLIEKKEKLIELLHEKRDITINDAVTNVKGITEKLKYIVSERRGKLDSVPNDVRYIGMENIESGTGALVEFAEKVEPESSVSIFKTGDVLFGKLRPYLAKVYSANSDGVCSGEFLTLTPKKNKVISEYLFYKLISDDFIRAINDSTYGTKMPRANWQFIGNQRITYPSRDQQRKITQSLDTECKFLKRLIDDLIKSIEVLYLYKSSLVYSAVTGKIKVD